MGWRQSEDHPPEAVRIAVAALAAAKDGTADRLVDLVGKTDLPMKKPRTESHAGDASDFPTNVEKTADERQTARLLPRTAATQRLWLGRKMWWSMPQ
jgi:hypothetical protein